MSQKNFTSYFAFLLLCFFSPNLAGQTSIIESKVKNEILQNADKYNLSQNDVQHLVVLNQYTDDKRGISYVYIGQQIDGIPVYNMQTTFYVTRKGDVGTVSSGFINSDKFSKSGSRSSLINPEDAVINAALAIGVLAPSTQLMEKRGDESIFAPGKITL